MGILIRASKVIDIHLLNHQRPVNPMLTQHLLKPSYSSLDLICSGCSVHIYRFSVLVQRVVDISFRKLLHFAVFLITKRDKMP